MDTAAATIRECCTVHKLFVWLSLRESETLVEVASCEVPRREVATDPSIVSQTTSTVDLPNPDSDHIYSGPFQAVSEPVSPYR